MRHLVAAFIATMAGPALGEPLTTVRTVAPPVTDFRLHNLPDHSSPAFRIDDPASKLRSGYGGSMIDLFPLAGGNFRLSVGPRLFGRAGRPRKIDPESQLLLPAFRAGGLRMSRRLAPAMLIGYGRTVDRGLTFGIDAGLIKGKISAVPDRIGRPSRSRVSSDSIRERQESPINELIRATALYRF